jgi:hypothetical protein
MSEPKPIDDRGVTDDSRPTEDEVVTALREDDRDPFEDADDVQHEKYVVTCIHKTRSGEVRINYRYTDGSTDHGKAMEPYSADIFHPGFEDDAATSFR